MQKHARKVFFLNFSRFMTTDSPRYLSNGQNPNFSFLEIEQETQVSEICGRWPLLGALCAGRCHGARPGATCQHQPAAETE